MNFKFRLPEDREFDVTGFGLNAVDHLVTVPRYPQFNTKTLMTSHQQLAGGQVSSAMVGVQRLGLKASYIGKVGYDNEGRILIDSLREEGVECDGVMITNGARTQSGVIIIEQFSGERTILWHHDDKTRIRPEELEREQITRAKVLHVDGFDTQAAIQAARWAHEAGMAVTADLDNIYEGLDGLLPLIDCLIMSQELTARLAGVHPGADSERDALKKLQARYGCYLVAMTQGARGALAFVEGEYIESPGFRPPVIRDTTGAGDAFRAGFIYGLIRNLSIEDAMRTANAVAALKCRKLGARAGLPTAVELRDFLNG
jgi:sugar/nucleoside kinase (ribokinase family)